MRNTKEKILTASLLLFAQKGYDSVSVTDIADSLSITKGALYKHYANKRDIFNSIVAKMFEIDKQRAEIFNVPEQKYEDNPESYKKITLKSITDFALAQFKFWTEDEFASNFRKMLCLEQYHNPEMAELYHNCITTGPVLYLADIFSEMVKNNLLKKTDCKQLALEFYSPMYLLICASDFNNGKHLTSLLKRHIKHFMEFNIKQ